MAWRKLVVLLMILGSLIFGGCGESEPDFTGPPAPNDAKEAPELVPDQHSLDKNAAPVPTPTFKNNM